jgi:hypothetical protein
MDRLCIVSSLSIAAIAGVGWRPPATAEAADFHVENKVYRADEKEPFNETTTLFRAGLVYDFVVADSQVDEATVFDRSRGRFLMLDAKRRLKTEISTADVKAFGKSLQQQAASHKEPLLQFMANPKFTEKAGAEDGTLELSSDWLIYRLKTTPARSAEAAEQYGEFAYWYAQLNAMMNPGSLPPFGRLKVNEVLEARGLLPVEVQMTLLPKESPRKQVVLRAEHRLQWTLLESDRQRIDEFGKQLATFRAVSLDEYRRHANEEARR